MKDLKTLFILICSAFLLALVIIFTAPSAESMYSVPVKQSNFDYAIKIVLQHEGGLSNDKSDPGGLTDFGISLRYIKDEHIDINGDGKIDRNDILQLTKTEADNIYLNDWWKKFHYDKIKDKLVATKIFDFAVNGGAGRAAQIAKRALNDIHGKFFEINGELDDRVIELLNATEPAVMLDALRAEESKFYRDIVKRNPSLAPFEKGWQRRAAW